MCHRGGDLLSPGSADCRTSRGRRQGKGEREGNGMKRVRIAPLLPPENHRVQQGEERAPSPDRCWYVTPSLPTCLSPLPSSIPQTLSSSQTSRPTARRRPPSTRVSQLHAQCPHAFLSPQSVCACAMASWSLSARPLRSSMGMTPGTSSARP